MVVANYACTCNIRMDEKEKQQRKDQSEVINELIGIIEYVKAIPDFRITQKKQSQCLVRRLKLLLPLLEEIRDLESPLPEECCVYLYKLKTAFRSAKKLLKACSVGSKIYLVRIDLLLDNLFILLCYIMSYSYEFAIDD